MDLNKTLLFYQQYFTFFIFSNTLPLIQKENIKTHEMIYKHDKLIFHKRRYYMDLIAMSSSPCSTCFVVVNRTVLLMDGNNVLACADIVAVSPSAQQTFPVTSFSR